jgi:hypothetical protein
VTQTFIIDLDRKATIGPELGYPHWVYFLFVSTSVTHRGPHDILTSDGQVLISMDQSGRKVKLTDHKFSAGAKFLSTVYPMKFVWMT